ncbi:MAG: hypothetical protein JWM93_553 [Frankiales bacterium]|nr:hypothetical protein [Frankiales bacterium]
MIRAVINPEKLGHMGTVAEAYAVLSETNDARRLGSDGATTRQA